MVDNEGGNSSSSLQSIEVDRRERAEAKRDCPQVEAMEKRGCCSPLLLVSAHDAQRLLTWRIKKKNWIIKNKTRRSQRSSFRRSPESTAP